MAHIVEGICSRVSLPSLENCRFEFQSRLVSSSSLSKHHEKSPFPILLRAVPETSRE